MQGLGTMTILISKRVRSRMDRCAEFSKRVHQSIRDHIRSRAHESIRHDLAIVSDPKTARVAVVEFSEFSA